MKLKPYTGGPVSLEGCHLGDSPEPSTSVISNRAGQAG